MEVGRGIPSFITGTKGIFGTMGASVVGVLATTGAGVNGEARKGGGVS